VIDDRLERARLGEQMTRAVEAFSHLHVAGT
jgi:hypothetical protein